MMVTRQPNQIVSMTSCLSRSGVNQFLPRIIGLSFPYLTLHWSWMLNDFAFGQFARICRSSGSLASPYFSMSFATL
jgi:hypothetical protein